MTTTTPTTRYFAVAGGHLHQESCAHRSGAWNRRTAQYGRSFNAHMKELDGMSPEDVVAKYGASCCSHCFRWHGATSGTKLTQTQIEDLDGTTARRAAMLNEIEAMQSAHSDELDAAIVAFHTADEAGDHETAGPLWRSMNALIPNRKYSTHQRWQTLKA